MIKQQRSRHPLTLGLPGRRGRLSPPQTAGAVFVLLGLLAVGPPLAHGAEGTAPEYQVKAAFLYNFAKFVQWPADAFPGRQSPFIVGVLGRDPFGTILDQSLKGKTAQGRSFVIKRASNLKGIGSCHILFISASEKERFAQILRDLRGPVLTVSESPGFARQGGIVNFFLENQKVRFEINPKQAEKVRLRISSQLLQLARIVQSG